MILRGALACLLALFAQGAVAATLTVGSGKTYSTIQAAINAAANGDTIEVYSDGGDNIYDEDLLFASKTNISVIGQVGTRGITIRGTGSTYIIRTQSSSSGVTIQNFTITNNSNNANAYGLIEGSSHTIRNNEFNGTRTAAAGSGPIVFGGSGHNILQNYFNTPAMYACMETMNPSNLTIKYNEFYGGVNYCIGTGSGGTGHTVAYNYVRDSTSSAINWLGVRMRNITNYNVKYNLIVKSINTRWQACLLDRQWETGLSGPATWEHNTCVMPRISDAGGYLSSGFGTEEQSGNNGLITVKNNLFYQGSYCGGGIWGPPGDGDVFFTYNYCYNPYFAPTTYYAGDAATAGWTKTANIETATIAPGFVGTGTVWQTDGTDAGTISQYYALQSGAPALTGCEGGTFCGAFSTFGGSVVAPDITSVSCSPTSLQAPGTTDCSATLSGGTPDSYAWAAQTCGTPARCTSTSVGNPGTFSCAFGGPCTLCLTATNTAGADTMCASAISVKYVKPSGFGAN